MKRGKRKLVGIFAAALVAGTLLSGPAMAGSDDSKVVASVGPYKLTLKEFNEQINSLPPQMRMAIMHNPQLKETFLERWVQITLLGMKARDMGLDKDPQVKERIEDLKNSLLAQELFHREIESKTKDVTDAEIKKYYNEHKKDFTTPEMVKARHILVRVKDDKDQNSWKAARKKAMEIKKELDNGADFAELAKKYSEDPGTKDRGGDLGYFGKGRMVPPFENAAFALKKGEVSDLVKTPFGYHLIKVEDRKPASTRSLDEVKLKIKEQVMQEKQRKAVEDMIAKLKKKYTVKMNTELIQESSAPPAHGGMGMK